MTDDRLNNMRHRSSITATILVILFIVNAFAVTGCKRKDYEQHYHLGMEELEHCINDELGSYLVIYSISPTTYGDGSVDENKMNVFVYFQPSYYNNSTKRADTPLETVVDRFRCIWNDYIRENPDTFWDEVEIRVRLGYEFDHFEEMYTLRNYIYDNNTEETNLYKLLVSESGRFSDYEFMQDKEDIIWISLLNIGVDENSSTDMYYESYCMQIDLFPNLQYVSVPDYPSMDEQLVQDLSEMITENYNLIVVLNRNW